MTNLHLQKLTMKKKQLRHATIIDLNLKEPGNTGSQGLHKAMERAIESSSFKFSQFKRQVEITSNAANPNRTLCVLQKEVVSNDLVFASCLQVTACS